jgi:predicted NUDIX family NTP pyrophosphohydrolase
MIGAASPLKRARTKVSAGLLLFRQRKGTGLQILLVHPGGPFWAKKDDGAWSIPKGEIDGNEDKLVAARREFAEETGLSPEGPFIELGGLSQPSGKTVYVWAVKGEWVPDKLKSNTFEMEWPKKSGRLKSFPEVDRAEWFDISTARRKILKGQVGFIERLMSAIEARE